MSFMFCLEFKSKVIEHQESIAVTDKAFEQIKSPKVMKTLEVIHFILFPSFLLCSHD